MYLSVFVLDVAELLSTRQHANIWSINLHLRVTASFIRCFVFEHSQSCCLVIETIRQVETFDRFIFDMWVSGKCAINFSEFIYSKNFYSNVCLWIFVVSVFIAHRSFIMSSYQMQYQFWFIKKMKIGGIKGKTCHFKYQNSQKPLFCFYFLFFSNKFQANYCWTFEWSDILVIFIKILQTWLILDKYLIDTRFNLNNSLHFKIEWRMTPVH